MSNECEWADTCRETAISPVHGSGGWIGSTPPRAVSALPSRTTLTLGVPVMIWKRNSIVMDIKLSSYHSCFFLNCLLYLLLIVCEWAITATAHEEAGVHTSQRTTVMSHCCHSPWILVVTFLSPGVMETLLPTESSFHPQLSFHGPSLKGTQAQG